MATGSYMTPTYSRSQIKPLPPVKIILDLLEPCTKKKEPKGTTIRDGMDTVVGFMMPRLVSAYSPRVPQTQSTIGVFLKYQDNTISKHNVSAEQIASKSTCKLIAIRKALDIYLTLLLYFRIIDLLLRPLRKEKWISLKKAIHFYSQFVHWANHAPSSGSLFMLISKGTR
ncbi:hypothetical protein TNCV_3680281 [Trichonephila clavipes]|nr:hypothetical protein TNCV_3680281 [Trichonephila clavipes]